MVSCDKQGNEPSDSMRGLEIPGQMNGYQLFKKKSRQLAARKPLSVIIKVLSPLDPFHKTVHAILLAHSHETNAMTTKPATLTKVSSWFSSVFPGKCSKTICKRTRPLRTTSFQFIIHNHQV